MGRGLAPLTSHGDTHVVVVLSTCSARLSMADDCKYGGSVSVCLSVRCLSVLASPVPVPHGCPCSAPSLPAWHRPGGDLGLGRFRAPGFGLSVEMGWQRQRRGFGGSQTDPVVSLCFGVGRGHWLGSGCAGLLCTPRASVSPYGPGWAVGAVGLRAESFPACSEEQLGHEVLVGRLAGGSMLCAGQEWDQRCSGLLHGLDPMVSFCPLLFCLGPSL